MRLFLAVGGPCRGLLFLGGRCSTSSSSSWNVVGSLAAALCLSAVRDRLSGNGRAYNWVASSSSSSSLTGLNEGRFLVCWGTHLPLGVSGDVGGFAKSGRLQRRLLGVVEELEQRRPRPECRGVGVEVVASA